MGDIEIRHATIESTMLGYEDHGIFTCMIYLNFGGSRQGFGGYALDEPIKIQGKFSHREGTKYGMRFMQSIINTVGVSSWEKLVGQNVRVKHDNIKVYDIGHFLEDKWFCPEDLV